MMSIYIYIYIYICRHHFIDIDIDIDINIYIYPNAKHVFAAYKIYVQVDIWGSRFILPHFNVIFNIYIADEVSIYIYN